VLTMEGLALALVESAAAMASWCCGVSVSIEMDAAPITAEMTVLRPMDVSDFLDLRPRHASNRADLVASAAGV
jgi:hypothetical protein